MQESYEQLMDILTSAIIFMAAIGFVIGVFAIGSRYNTMLAKEINQKASSRHTLPYSEAYIYLSPEEVVTDIMASDDSIMDIYIDTNQLSFETIVMARDGNVAYIRAIRNALTQSRYRKRTDYDINGDVRALHFIP